MENLMPRFYFNLASRDAYIPDDSGKELKTLHDAHAHARKLIDKISHNKTPAPSPRAKDK
jgi:hypothetical protein